MKEKILETLRTMGFCIEPIDEYKHAFTYEGINYVYVYSDNDDEFLNIVVPAINDFNEDNALMMYQLMDKINTTLKYVKAHVINGNVWIAYEREVLGDEDMENVLAHMILHLERALNFARKLMETGSEE